jgi:phosphohistidine swiveling domain-containing protein
MMRRQQGGTMSDASVNDPVVEGKVEWLPERAFRAEDADKLWFHDLLHNSPPSTPMGASVHHWPRGTKFASEFLHFPFSRGFDYVVVDGRIYPGPIPITDQAEIDARLPQFGAKMQDMLENWPAKYKEMTDEWTSMLSYLRGIKKDSLPLDKLLGVLRDAVNISKRSWELHFVGMYPEIIAYSTFEAVCAKHGIEERQMRTFLQGFETKMYEIDRGMWWLADLAATLGLADTFIDSDAPQDLYAKLKESDKGRVWTDEFNIFLEKYGRRTTAALFDPYYKTWLEDPYPALSTIRTYVQKGGFDYEEHTRKITEERDRYIEETVAKFTNDADKDEFMRALRDAQNTYPFNEDHNFYVEQWTYSELRYAIQECGRRLIKFGIIEGDDPDDVFFLTIAELENILDELVRDEFMGVSEHSRRVPSLIKKRKQTWLDLHKVDPPTFIGTIPEGRVDDPVFIKIWGFTNEVIKGEAKPEEDIAGQVEGMPGAPGIIEGIARVIFGYEGFSEIQPDDVLVAPFTTPAWTPLFSKIKGVVTDSGGMLAHAAICAREYDIPAVVGTVTRGKKATQIIKTGDHIRVNGTEGLVQILKS